MGVNLWAAVMHRWMNRPYAYSSDMWALGCLVYELATYRSASPLVNICECPYWLYAHQDVKNQDFSEPGRKLW
jgi:serine/threonine protein kinase